MLSSNGLEWRVSHGARIIRSGGVIAHPTETVFGLACDPWQGSAVERVLELKNRSWQKGLILVAGDARHFDFLLHDLPEEKKKILALSWPGANTWLVPHRECVPQWIHGAFDTVAIRVSAHPLIRQLSDEVDGPIVSTSANCAGHRPALNTLDVRTSFSRSTPYIIAGQCRPDAKPSVIRDLYSGNVIR